MKANYKRYQVQLRIDEDADLIAFIDKNKAKYGTTELFRAAIEKLKNEGLNWPSIIKAYTVYMLK